MKRLLRLLSQVTGLSLAPATAAPTNGGTVRQKLEAKSDENL
ncbi:MAG: hypothetical protein RLZZ15_2644 [Verrucomicrobiota bacterium]